MTGRWMLGLVVAGTLSLTGCRSGRELLPAEFRADPVLVSEDVDRYDAEATGTPWRVVLTTADEESLPRPKVVVRLLPPRVRDGVVELVATVTPPPELKVRAARGVLLYNVNSYRAETQPDIEDGETDRVTGPTAAWRGEAGAPIALKFVLPVSGLPFESDEQGRVLRFAVSWLLSESPELLVRDLAEFTIRADQLALGS